MVRTRADQEREAQEAEAESHFKDKDQEPWGPGRSNGCPYKILGLDPKAFAELARTAPFQELQKCSNAPRTRCSCSTALKR